MNKRKIILNLCTSLDFFIEGENGEIDWCLTDQDYGMTDFLARIDTILLGRKSYIQLVREAPTAFSDKKKIVFSTTLKEIPDGVKIIRANIEEEVNTLLNTPGKDIWLFGGKVLTSALLELNLIDEFIIAIHPLILGQGKPLLIPNNQRKKLILTDTKTFSTGLVQLYYKVDK
ncbi:dihydrofolate reductase [Fulvivirga sp. M361]|uniref:dihydrofolate reductase family protein n=1 Tax=Fulvivirga sp. M361 TaxID=2594266 RepID=UPI00117990D5|nr:dihydrofolate reductase family protein [Fulvivirga sp. M361]TRX48063.1 dihydrofolate reductase [Fulvivirga sp. M361]